MYVVIRLHPCGKLDALGARASELGALARTEENIFNKLPAANTGVNGGFLLQHDCRYRTGSREANKEKGSLPCGKRTARTAPGTLFKACAASWLAPKLSCGVGYMEQVIIYCRLPVPGRVKTRLAATIGADRACEFYKACAEHVIAECAR